MTYEIGKTYRVEARDCCVDVTFTSKLVKVVQLDADSDPEFTFENGVEIHGMCTKLTLVTA